MESGALLQSDARLRFLVYLTHMRAIRYLVVDVIVHIVMFCLAWFVTVWSGVYIMVSAMIHVFLLFRVTAFKSVHRHARAHRVVGILFASASFGATLGFIIIVATYSGYDPGRLYSSVTACYALAVVFYAVRVFAFIPVVQAFRSWRSDNPLGAARRTTVVAQVSTSTSTSYQQYAPQPTYGQAAAPYVQAPSTGQSGQPVYGQPAYGQPAYGQYPAPSAPPADFQQHMPPSQPPPQQQQQQYPGAYNYAP